MGNSVGWIVIQTLPFGGLLHSDASDVPAFRGAEAGAQESGVTSAFSLLNAVW